MDSGWPAPSKSSRPGINLGAAEFFEYLKSGSALCLRLPGCSGLANQILFHAGDVSPQGNAGT